MQSESEQTRIGFSAREPNKGGDAVQHLHLRAGDIGALAVLALGIVGIAWAPIFFRLSEAGPVATAFWRITLAVPLLYSWWRLDAMRSGGGERRPSDWRDRLQLIGAGLFFAGDLAFWHWSLTWTTVANATLFANAAPLFVTLAGWLLFGQRFRPLFLGGLAVAVVGAGLLMGASVRLGPDHLVGDLLGLVTASFLAGYLLVVERLRARFTTATIMLWSAASGIIPLLLLAMATEDRLMPGTWQGWAVLLGLAAISHAGGQSLIAQAMARLPAAFTALSLLLQPVLAAIFAWAVLGEPVLAQQALGGMVILGGIMLARRGSRKPVEPSTGVERE